MLRDDAIRQGLIYPTKEDIKRMGLIPERFGGFKSKQKKRGPKDDDVDLRTDPPKKIHKELLC